MKKLLVILISLLTIDGFSQMTLNNVTLPAKINVDKTDLLLNGGGIRKKAFFKVYVIGLYTTAKTTEIYRRAGRFHKALTLNESINDQKVKLKQRLSILLALKQNERAANMESGLYRNGLLEDQDVRYALAHALFSSRRFSEANKHLDHLTSAELFRKGTELRRLMEVCKNEPWQCT